MGLLYEKLTYAIRGCIFEVHNQLKTGLDEETYHLALEKQLSKKGFFFESKPNSFLEHRGIIIYNFIPDFLIENKIILELKNIRTDFIPVNYIQLTSYLKHWQIDLGMLANFGLPSAKFDRVLFSEKELELSEDYSEIENFITLNDRDYFEKAKSAILNILYMHGLGFNYSIYQALFQAELSYQNIPFSPSVIIPIHYDEEFIRNFNLKIPLINNKILCGITAGQKDLKIQILAIRNYLKKIKIPFGLIANFGNKKLEIIAVRNTN